MPDLRRICVYCGSSSGNNPVYHAAARAVGAFLAQSGIGIVYGGGNVGLMGALADGALAHHGEVIGVIPQALLDKELGHRRVSALHVVRSMHERKQMMADLSAGFIALPGGFGTLEELFETLTWLQLSFHDKPVGLLNIHGFFDPLLGFIQQMNLSGFLRPEHAELLLVENEIAPLLQRMRAFAPPAMEKWAEPPSPSAR